LAGFVWPDGATMDLHPLSILEILILATLANGTPVIATRVFGSWAAWPLDGGTIFLDGRPLLGASKTLRGIVLGVFAAALGAALIGLSWTVGLRAGAAAMAGDLLSSFLKRRLGLHSSGRATGLDQVPESLFAFLACLGALPLSALDMIVVVALFFVGEVLLSRLLFRLRLRDRPY
jgi:CDP-diglyceride synthetase